MSEENCRHTPSQDDKRDETVINIALNCPKKFNVMFNVMCSLKFNLKHVIKSFWKNKIEDSSFSHKNNINIPLSKIPNDKNTII